MHRKVAIYGGGGPRRGTRLCSAHRATPPLRPAYLSVYKEGLALLFRQESVGGSMDPRSGREDIGQGSRYLLGPLYPTPRTALDLFAPLSRPPRGGVTIGELRNNDARPQDIGLVAAGVEAAPRRCRDRRVKEVQYPRAGHRTGCRRGREGSAAMSR